MKPLATLILCLLCASARAATYTAATANQADVQAAVNLATNGDTVNVPPGNSTWPSFLLITNNIQLLGSGIGQTIIIDGVPRSGGQAPLIKWLTQSNSPCRLSGLTFQVGDLTLDNPVTGSVEIYGYCSAFRADHLRFNSVRNVFIEITQGVSGVIDHCDFYETNGWENCVEYYPGSIGGNGDGNQQGWGDVSWSSPPNYGTTNGWLYIEDSTFYYKTAPWGGVNDLGSGGKMVFRYNAVTNLFFKLTELKVAGVRAVVGHLKSTKTPLSTRREPVELNPSDSEAGQGSFLAILALGLTVRWSALSIFGLAQTTILGGAQMG